MMMLRKRDEKNTYVNPLACPTLKFVGAVSTLYNLRESCGLCCPPTTNLPHHTNNESHLSCQHWHCSWSTIPVAHIPSRYSHEGWLTLTLYRRLGAWNGHPQELRMICFSLLVVLSFLYLLVAVFTDTSAVIYWRKNAIRKLNVINQRCLFLAHLVFTKMKLVFIVQSLVSVTFFTKNLTSFEKCYKKIYLKYVEKKYHFCGWERGTISKSMSQFLRI